MSPDKFIGLLAQAIANVEDSQSVDVFDAQTLIDALADSRIDSDHKEWLITLCSQYAEEKNNIIYNEAFSSIVAFNAMEGGNENE